jgi:hypothetical protein
MDTIRNPLAILPSLLLFLIPVNLCFPGDGAVTVIQWALFRYQPGSGGESLTSFTQDLYAAIATGGGGLAPLLWALATLLLIGYVVMVLRAILAEDAGLWTKSALLLPVCGSLFLIADMTRYGALLSGPGGTCIPVEIPLFFIFGCWGYASGQRREGQERARDQRSPNNKEGAAPGIVSRLAAWSGSHPYRDLATLAVIAFTVKAIVFFPGLLPNLPLNVILGDTRLYYWYATSLTWGQVPYASYNVPYPQFFFIPVLLALVPALLVQGYAVYLWSFSALMIVIDTATLVLVYSIAARLWGQEKAFLCGFLYATAFSAAFFVPIYYDAVPSFLLVLSLWTYLYRNQVGGFLLGTAGALAKWFPAFALPYYVLHQHKTGRDRGIILKECLLAGSLVLVAVVPFILLNAGGFLTTYTMHVARMPEVNSFMYYLDAIGALAGIGPVHACSLLLVLAAELSLLYGYYRYLDARPETLVACIFLAILVFVLANKVFSTNYILWLAPFLALLLCRTPRHILVFYLVQAVMYLETPVLFGIVYAPFTGSYTTGTSYTVLAQSLPSLSFLFYTVKFGLLFLVLFVVVRDLKIEKAGPGGERVRQE